MGDKVILSELQQRIIFTVLCVDAFATRFHLTSVQSFHYLQEYEGIQFLKECYSAEHTLGLEDVVDDLVLVCRNHGGAY
ncbi:MAG: DUF3791 domain-containing protein [Succinivibrio sp.]|nr:DUF3791 domain-containing protein [Succinivibrio sp.]